MSTFDVIYISKHNEFIPIIVKINLENTYCYLKCPDEFLNTNNIKKYYLIGQVFLNKNLLEITDIFHMLIGYHEPNCNCQINPYNFLASAPENNPKIIKFLEENYQVRGSIIFLKKNHNENRNIDADENDIDNLNQQLKDYNHSLEYHQKNKQKSFFQKIYDKFLDFLFYFIN